MLRSLLRNDDKKLHNKLINRLNDYILCGKSLREGKFDAFAGEEGRDLLIEAKTASEAFGTSAGRQRLGN